MGHDNGSGNGTGKSDMQDMILDVLKEIRDKLSSIETELGEVKEEQGKQGERIDSITADLHLVHELQKTFGDRLHGVEKFCVQQPLRSARPSPLPHSSKRDGR